MSDATLRLDFGVEPAADEPAVDVPVTALTLAVSLPFIPFTWSEQHRHECEVRLLVAQGREWSVEFCRVVADKRGRASAETLWIDARREAKRVGAWLKR